jgi:hypothetical protein
MENLLVLLGIVPVLWLVVFWLEVLWLVVFAVFTGVPEPPPQPATRVNMLRLKIAVRVLIAKGFMVILLSGTYGCRFRSWRAGFCWGRYFSRHAWRSLTVAAV